LHTNGMVDPREGADALWHDTVNSKDVPMIAVQSAESTK
jgi:hypothetical protein